MYTIIQIIVSVVVIYLIFSVIVYVITEWFASLVQMRGKMLRDAVLNLFKNKDIGELIYNHPHVESLKNSNGKLPSYIPASSIAAALIDAVGSKADDTREKRTRSAHENFLNGIDKFQGKQRDLLIALAQQATNVKELSASIEKWFNDAMDRVSGWYKKRMRLVLFIVSAIVTVIFNVDTVHIILQAKADPVLRQRMNDLGDKLLQDQQVNQLIDESQFEDYHDDYVNDSSITTEDSIAMVEKEEAGRQAKDSTLFKSNTEKIDQLIYMNQIIQGSDLPVGWGIKRDAPWLYVVLGWLITTVALTAGAPFWFDVLKRLVNVRSAGIKPSTPSTNKN